MADRPGGGGVAAVDRAFAIVAAVAEEIEPISLARIAAATGFYKSTVLRLLASIEAAGYVSRLADGRYAIGPAAQRLGTAYERSNPFRNYVQPVLKALVDEGSESASFHVRCGPDRRLCLFRVDSRHPTLDRINPGDVLPLDRGAAGRVLAAFDEPGDARLAQVRVTCFAQSLGEREVGCSGLAAPVFTADTRLAGALSLSGPTERFTPDMIATWRPRLITAAVGLSGVLGGDYPATAG
ncbi:IclR family transcriptional regulator [Novosphingobium sp. M1R2S20]|uniref:IclR family transcriptional regulator n=1 Tax=Novosphingobium rhizovicinum TaxID=3228928 RepID=A0ABV3RDS0_9SPHN